MKKKPARAAPWTSDRIAKLRARLDLTQEQFAHRLGVTVLTVSRWENGHRAPRGLSKKALDAVLPRQEETE